MLRMILPLTLLVSCSLDPKDSTPNPVDTGWSEADADADADTGSGFVAVAGPYDMSFLTLLSDSCDIQEEISGGPKEIEVTVGADNLQIAIDIGEPATLTCNLPDPGMDCYGDVQEVYSEWGLSVTVTQTIALDTTWDSATSFGGNLTTSLSCSGDCGVAETLLGVSFPCSAEATIQAVHR